MKYKIDDEVLVKVKINDTCEGDAHPYEVKAVDNKFCKECARAICVREEDIVPTPDMTAEEAWELAKRIEMLSLKETYEIFKCKTPSDILNHFSPQQAKAKIEAWEAAKEIKVGDFVEIENKIFCVTSFVGEYCCGIDENGSVYSASKKDTKKTGRRIDIDGFLKQIGWDE